MVSAINSVSSPKSVISTAEIVQAIVLLSVRTVGWVMYLHANLLVITKPVIGTVEIVTVGLVEKIVSYPTLKKKNNMDLASSIGNSTACLGRVIV